MQAWLEHFTFFFFFEKKTPLIVCKNADSSDRYGLFQYCGHSALKVKFLKVTLQYEKSSKYILAWRKVAHLHAITFVYIIPNNYLQILSGNIYQKSELLNPTFSAMSFLAFSGFPHSWLPFSRGSQTLTDLHIDQKRAETQPENQASYKVQNLKNIPFFWPFVGLWIHLPERPYIGNAGEKRRPIFS